MLMGGPISTNCKVKKQSYELTEVMIVLNEQTYIRFPDRTFLVYFYWGLNIWFSACRKMINSKKRNKTWMLHRNEPKFALNESYSKKSQKFIVIIFMGVEDVIFGLLKNGKFW